MLHSYSIDLTVQLPYTMPPSYSPAGISVWARAMCQRGKASSLLHLISLSTSECYLLFRWQQKHHQSKLCFPKSKFFPNVCVSWCSSILKPSVGNNIRWFPVSFRLCAHLLSAVWLVCLNKSTIFLDVVGSDLLCHAATGQLSFPSVKLKQATL